VNNKDTVERVRFFFFFLLSFTTSLINTVCVTNTARNMLYLFIIIMSLNNMHRYLSFLRIFLPSQRFNSTARPPLFCHFVQTIPKIVCFPWQSICSVRSNIYCTIINLYILSDHVTFHNAVVVRCTADLHQNDLCTSNVFPSIPSTTSVSHPDRKIGFGSATFTFRTNVVT
jgi:hypothetical protein